MTTSHFGELLDLHGLGEDRKRNRSFCLVHLYNSSRDGTLGWHKARSPRNCFSTRRGGMGEVYRVRYAG